MIDYDGRRFRGVTNSETGQVDGATIFEYRQDGHVLWASYSGGEILRGFIVGLVDGDGNLDFRYQHVDRDGVIRTGTCASRPEMLPDGRVRLHERWQWTSGGRERGESIVEEIAPGR